MFSGRIRTCDSQSLSSISQYSKPEIELKRKYIICLYIEIKFIWFETTTVEFEPVTFKVCPVFHIMYSIPEIKLKREYLIRF